LDVASWLRNLDLERYAAAFRENGVSAEDLCHLTAEDLDGLGVTAIGHRRRLLVAIAALRSEGPSPGDPVRLSSDSPINPTGNLGSSESTAERRPLSVMFCDLVGSTVPPHYRRGSMPRTCARSSAATKRASPIRSASLTASLRVTSVTVC
jgi:hypothetical protein